MRFKRGAVLTLAAMAGPAPVCAFADTAPSRQEHRPSSAPVVNADFEAMRVELDDLEDAPRKYIGQTVSVDATIEEVLGPRVFTIDEPGWGDPARELLVYMAEGLVPLVRENDRVTITGTVKPFVAAVLEEHEWIWLDVHRRIDLTIAQRPVLVASRIVGGNDDFAMVVDARPAMDGPVSASGGTLSIADMAVLGGGDEDLVGRRVDLRGARIQSVAGKRGFFVEAPGKALFVLPAGGDSIAIRAGDSVSLRGFVLAMPENLEERLNAPAGANDDIYVYATTVSK